MTDLEQRLIALENRSQQMKLQAEKLKAIGEIQFLMGKLLSLWQSPLTRRYAVELYANRDDSSHESYCGYHVGMDALRAYLAPENFDEMGIEETGTFFSHDLTTPVIVVADDLQTARGLWWSPGAECFAGMGNAGKPDPLWCWAKYHNDFIKVDGEWKVWHTHFCTTFMTPYHLSWVDVPDEERGGLRCPGDGPEAPGCKSNVYDPHGVFQCWPDAPQPYKTWTDDRMRP